MRNVVYVWWSEDNCPESVEGEILPPRGSCGSNLSGRA